MQDEDTTVECEFLNEELNCTLDDCPCYLVEIYKSGICFDCIKLVY